MRQFVVLGHEVPLSSDFSLDDLTGAGRVDVLCRCINSAICLSPVHRAQCDLWVRLGLRPILVRFETVCDDGLGIELDQSVLDEAD